jgi:hypothetical protein
MVLIVVRKLYESFYQLILCDFLLFFFNNLHSSGTLSRLAVFALVFHLLGAHVAYMSLLATSEVSSFCYQFLLFFWNRDSHVNSIDIHYI